MNSIEIIKALCKERGIPISRLEKACGFSNGYFGSLKKGVLPNDRAKKVADFFGVSTDYITTGKDEDGYYIDQETARAAQEMFENEELRALFDVSKDMSPDDLRAMYGIALALKRKEKGTD